MDKDLGMKVRKEQLKKLDDFVHTLYKEVETFENYGVNLKDVKMLYMHIHELIQEMLQCKSTEEFMDMIEELHKSIAGVLIVVAPANASQVKEDMNESYTDFKADSFDDLINQIHKTASEKFGERGKEKAEEMEKDLREEEEKERTEEDTEDMLRALELENLKKKNEGIVKRTKEKLEKKKEELSQEKDDNDPLDDLW